MSKLGAGKLGEAFANKDATSVFDTLVDVAPATTQPPAEPTLNEPVAPQEPAAAPEAPAEPPAAQDAAPAGKSGPDKPTAAPRPRAATTSAPATEKAPKPDGEVRRERKPKAPTTPEVDALGLPLKRNGRERPTRNRLAISLPLDIAEIVRVNGRAMSDVPAAAIAEDQSVPKRKAWPDTRRFTKIYLSNEHVAILDGWVAAYAAKDEKVSVSELIATAVDRWYTKRTS